jgi:hypothetical protein
LRKCCKDQVPTGGIATSEKRVIEIQVSWPKFLLNPFLIDCREAQDKGMELHYAWMLILITLVAWRELKDTQFFVPVKKPCLAMCDVKLWHTTHKESQLDKNIMFYVYKEVSQTSI